MIRASLIPELEAAGVHPNREDVWCWSLWEGYLDRPGEQLSGWLGKGGAVARHVHTSGHATIAHLKAFSDAVAPRRTVPIQGVAWDGEGRGIPPLRRLHDSEVMEI